MTEFKPIPALRGVERRTFDSGIAAASRPVVLEGLVTDWPLVRAARESRAALACAIRLLDCGLLPHVI